MKAKSKILNLLLILFPMLFFAQGSYYYYYQGKKVPLTLDTKKINISVFQKFESKSLAKLKIKKFTLENDRSVKTEKLRRAVIEFTETQNNIAFFQNLNRLNQEPNIRNVSLYFKRNNSSSIGTSNIFYVKLRRVSDFERLQEIANLKNVSIIHQNRFMPLWYKLILHPHSSKTSLQLSNEFFETGLFDDVDPAFMFNFNDSCTNDPNFGSLWGLYNSSNTNYDINVCNAWSITEGNGVNVAVLDNGVYKQHNDLSNNISPLSFDTESSSSPSVFTTNFNHGTHVSGTIAAIKDNNLQVVGVAPQSKIMSISNRLMLSPNLSEELANGINWAWQNGADVINNSWGDQGGVYYNQLHSALLENAILNAQNSGRNGKGTIIVFAAGNHSPAIDYPASFNANIVCVGAITSSGARSSFSGYGSQLDIVAPGSNILSTVPTQSVAPYNGTSMAAPHVTGTIALLLSVNPSLTLQQVNNIIESTAQKIGNYSYTNNINRPNGTWNNQMGYGLIDAFAAVQMASPTLNGPDTICTNSNYTYTLQGGGVNNVSWQVSSNLQIINSSSNSITVKALNNSTVGYASVIATINNSNTITKNLYIGTQITVDEIDAALAIDGEQEILVETNDGVYDLQWRVNGVLVNDNGNDWVRIYFSDYPCINNVIVLSMRKNGVCGWSNWVSIDYTECSDEFFRLSSNPMKSGDIANEIIIIDPNNDRFNNYQSISIFNKYGRKVFFNTDKKLKYDVSHLKKGFYIVKIEANDGNVLTKKLIVR